ncbi:MAG: hypothetical protein PUP93_16500 [Rhizonema sp. NSF051]|nr:hypothetical protein [Rhizonema sp. NSF051]
MSQNHNKAEDILNRIVRNSRANSVTSKIIEFVSNNRGKNTNAVAENIIQFGVSKRNLTTFVGNVEDSTSNLIKEKKIDGLLWESRTAVLNIAESRNIPVHPAIYQTEPHENPQFQRIYAGLNFSLRGADNLTFARECLKWVNCLIEFYSGEPWFEDEAHYTSPHDNSRPNNLSELIESKVSREETQNITPKEKIIYELWQQGFLQTDRFK